VAAALVLDQKQCLLRLISPVLAGTYAFEVGSFFYNAWALDVTMRDCK
jgi:hypothetical protein